MISARTKAALAQARKRGVKLGGNRGVKPTAKMRAASTAALQKRAERAADIAPTIAELQADGATTLKAIADGLNKKGIPTARGSGEWSAVQVQLECSSARKPDVAQIPLMWGAEFFRTAASASAKSA